MSEQFAFLDIAWSPHKQDLLAACTSTGLLVFYTITTDSINRLTETRVSDPEILVLDLQFDPIDPSLIGITLSDGRTCLVRLRPALLSALESMRPVDEVGKQGQISVIDHESHSLEAWTLAFSKSSVRGIYSGGDDAVLHYKPLPGQESPADGAQLLPWKDSKIHSAGVTALLELDCLASNGQILVTGSYDDHIRVVDPPAPQTGRRRATVLAELDLGGGVWRLELIRQVAHTYFLLASCMHAGCKVVAVTEKGSSPGEQHGDGTWEIRVVTEFTEHKSMNYASCVHALSGPNADDERAGHVKIISTSFYDQLMCLWGCELR